MMNIYVITKRCYTFVVREGVSWDELCPQYGAKLDKKEVESKCEKLNKSNAKKHSDSVNPCPYSVVAVRCNDIH